MWQYHVTIALRKEIESEWQDWIRETHIPEMLATGKFISARLYKQHEKPEGWDSAFTVIYNTHSRANLQEYLDAIAPKMRKKGEKLFGNKFSASRSILQLKRTFS